MNQTYLTTDELAGIIHYDSRTIRTRLKDAVLLEGVHYIRPFGGRKLLFIRETIERDIGKFSADKAAGPPVARSPAAAIPMANGGMVHG
ncbi:MAG: hypothetical protein ABS98_11760 [Lysobacteraceae bacterium SCN 69-48]|nr:MAG: hypothetical protein ABS98_11760 [Xanthomonadaceae bacterium SCN 69-48]